MATSTTPDSEPDRLISDLRELAPPPAPPALSSTARARMEADLLAAIERASKGPRARGREQLTRRGPAVLVAACVAAAAAIVTMSLTATSPDRVPTALPVLADAEAVHALDRLTTVALTTATPTVGEDQYVYVRSTVIANEGDFSGAVSLEEPREREIWLSQDPSPTKDSGLIRESGQDWPLRDGYPAPAGPHRPTYQWLSTLPTEPDRIITELGGHQLPGSPLTTEQYTFERIGDLITEGLVPPDLSGALFQAVTKIPGVVHVARAHDAIERPGFGIARTDEFSGITTMWVFGPGSPTPLGTRWYLPGPASAPHQDTLFGATAILERGVADELGTRPDPASARRT